MQLLRSLIFPFPLNEAMVLFRPYTSQVTEQLIRFEDTIFVINVPVSYFEVKLTFRYVTSLIIFESVETI